MAQFPLYMTFADTLITDIESGKWSAGDRLPSERTMADEFNINRQTVRQGLSLLINRGLIEKIRGSGTFISQPRLERDVTEFLDFSERIKRQGYSPGSTVMAFERIKPSKKIANDLAITQDVEVFRFHRLRTINDQPIVLETFSVPAGVVPDIEKFDLNERSFYEVLRSEYQIEVSHSEQSLEAVALSEIEAQWLQAEPASPAMLERRLSFDQYDRPIESGTDLYRGDRVRFNSGSVWSLSTRES